MYLYANAESISHIVVIFNLLKIFAHGRQSQDSRMESCIYDETYIISYYAPFYTKLTGFEVFR